MFLEVVTVKRASEMYKRLSVFDGVVSSILSTRADIPRDLYEKLLRKFGEYVLYPRLSSAQTMKRFQEFNCDRMLIDCYAHWRDTIHPVDLRESVIDTNPGWRAMDRFCHQKRRLLSSPSRTDVFVLSHIEDSSLYDFYPIIIRTPIKAPQHRLNVHTIQGMKGLFAMGIGNTMQEIADDSLQASLDDPLSANSKSSGEVHRIHLSYFRYLIAKKKFAEHISDIVEAVSAAATSNTTALNDSNMTLLDTPPLLAPRRGRRRSSVTDQTVSSPFDPLDLFTIHCLNFFCSFGSGLLVKISNDIVNAFVSPSSEYIRSLITTKSVRTAPTDSHSVIRKYLASNFLQSIRALIADRAHGETAEDACLSFLFRAEICTKAKVSYRVISSLVYAAVRFIIAETRNDINSVSVLNRYFSQRHQVIMKNKLIEWLGILGISPEHFTSSPLMLTMVKESRIELDLLYREISGSVEPVGWEDELRTRIKACERLTKADLRLLITTANGMGISPVPLGEEVSGINQTMIAEDEDKNDQVVVEPTLMQQLMEELHSIREEMAISKRNSEILYMELSRVKHKLAMDQVDDEIIIDEKLIA